MTLTARFAELSEEDNGKLIWVVLMIAANLFVWLMN